MKKRLIFNLKFLLLFSIILGFLSVPLYYPLVMHNILIVLAVIIQTSILTESSIPVWIYIINLDKLDTALVVIFFSQTPLVLLFWPQIITNHLPEKTKNKLYTFFIRSKLSIKFFFQTNHTKNKNKIFWLTFFALFFMPNFLPNFVLKIRWYHCLLIMAILFFSYLLWNHFKKNKQIIQKYIIGLGFVGIIIGAGTPLVPFTREAGMAAVFFLNNNRAKMLFIAVDILRIIVEIILIY